MKNTIKKISEGTYEYRGYQINRHENVPNGYWGKWSVGFRWFTTDSRQECVAWIDRTIAKKEATNA